MLSIIDLPAEILVEIFEFLCPSDRRVASLVCKKFLHIWFKAAFDKDRRLVFTDCVIRNEAPPLNIFIRTEVKYKQLVLGDSKFMDYSPDLWLQLGKTVTCLEFDESFAFNLEHHSNFLRYFPNLCELKISASKCEDLKRFYFSYIPHKVKKLSISLRYFESDLEFLDTSLIRKILGLTNLELEGVIINEKSIEFINLHRNLITKLEIYVTTPIIEKLFELYAPNVTQLKILCVRSAICILDSVINKFPKVQNISFRNLISFPTKNFHHLKTLEVGIVENTLEALSALKYLSDVEELDLKLCVTETDCFFGHVVYLNCNVRQLRLSNYKESASPCLECFKHLIHSFPNLEVIITNLPLFKDHLKALCDSLKKLRILKMEYTIVEPSNDVPPFEYIPSNLTELQFDQYLIKEAAITQWPLMPHLKRLSLNLVPINISIVSFAKMLDNLPVLEGLYFVQNSYITKELIPVIAKRCKRLKEIVVFDDSKQGQISYRDLKCIVDHCHFIQKIRFSVVKIKKSEEWKLKGLFYLRSSLKEIRTHLLKVNRKHAFGSCRSKRGSVF